MSYWYEVLRDPYGRIAAVTALTATQVRAFNPEGWYDARPPVLKARPAKCPHNIERDVLSSLTAPVDPATIRYAPGVKPLQPAEELPDGISMLTDPTIGEGRFLLRSLEQIVIGTVTPPRPANRDHHTAGRVAHHDVASLLAERARAAAAGHEHGAVVRLRGPWGELWIDGGHLPVRIDPPASRDLLFGTGGAVGAHYWDVGERRILLDELGRYGTERAKAEIDYAARRAERNRITITGV